MTQTAKVVAIDGEYAIVRVSRKAMCDGCHNSGSACSQCLTFGEKEAECRAKNTVGAKVGDTVTVSTKSSLVIGYAALVFVLPMLMAFGIYMLCSYLNNEHSILFSTVGFLLSFCAFCVVLDRKIKSNPDTEVISVTDEKTE